MFHLTPAPFHRLALRAGHRMRKIWWRWRKPRISGVAVIARDDAGRILLIRLSYGSGDWSFPAGGLNSGEDPAEAVRREFFEELGCALSEVSLMITREEIIHGARDMVHLFTARVDGIVRPDQREVVQAGFFAEHDLPEPLEKRVRERLDLLVAAELPVRR